MGYRYFDTIGYTPTYPFGYGVGYTTFTVEPKSMTADAEKVTVTATVRNTGDKAGKEVVQVYYSAPEGNLDKPYQELAGYAGLLTTWLTAIGRWDDIMYGTDWPIVNLGEYIHFIQRIVPEAQWEKVFFHNASRIYGLDLTIHQKVKKSGGF